MAIDKLKLIEHYDYRTFSECFDFQISVDSPAHFESSISVERVQNNAIAKMEFRLHSSRMDVYSVWLQSHKEEDDICQHSQ